MRKVTRKLVGGQQKLDFDLAGVVDGVEVPRLFNNGPGPLSRPVKAAASLQLGIGNAADPNSHGSRLLAVV